MARRRKPGKKRRARGSTDSMSSEQNLISPDGPDTEECLQILVERDNLHVDSCGSLEGPDGPEPESMRNGREDEDPEAGLRLPVMTDTSMDSVGQPLSDVMDRLNGSLDGETWEQREGDEGEVGRPRASPDGTNSATGPPQQRPFREDMDEEPPDPSFLQAPRPPADFYCFTSQSPDPAASCGGHHDSAGNDEPQDVPVGHENERKAEEQAPSSHVGESAEEERSTEEEQEEDKNKAIQSSHPAEFK